jgi:Periplasmic copper-binding protein (NosD)
VALATDHPFLNEYDDGVTVANNQIFGTANFDAIDACTNGNTITGNTITNSSESAIHLDSSCSAGSQTTGNRNTVNSNTINESACAGILADAATTGNTIGADTFFNVPFTLTASTAGCQAPAAMARITNLVTRTGRRAFSPKGSARKR